MEFACYVKVVTTIDYSSSNVDDVLAVIMNSLGDNWVLFWMFLLCTFARHGFTIC